MKRRSELLTLVGLGVVACCGVSAVLTAAVGASVLGVATEVWVLAIAGLLVLSALAVPAVTRQAR